MENGYESPKIFTEHTCAFDSIYPIFCALLLDHDEAKKQFISNDPFSVFIQNIVERPKSLTKLYNSRNEILFQIFSSDAYIKSGNMQKLLPNRKSVIDCFTGLAGFFSQLKVASYIECGDCKTCGFVKKTTYSQIPLKTNFRNGMPLDDLESKLSPGIKKKKCSRCKQYMSVSRKLQNVIAFEVEPLDGNNWYELENIQSAITVDDEKFQLLGVISYSHKHFTAYILRKNNVWENYDDLNPKAKKKISMASKIKVNAFMLFYVKTLNK